VTAEDGQVATPSAPSTTPAVAAVAETRERGRRAPDTVVPTRVEPGEGTDFTIGEGVTRAVEGRPYERRPEDPLYRPLRIFALDPALSQLEGSIAVVNVPYEPIEPPFRGHVFEVDAGDGGNGSVYRPLDLDDRAILLNQGRRPSPSDPLFHQQMVYAVASVVYASFKTALGRDLAWGFARRSSTDGRRLRLRPFAMNEQNAYYDEDAGELAFGYFRAEGTVFGRNLPKGLVFTSLSHDVIAHETTHALLDGLRADFTVPSGPDVLAFHEGFADLVAIFQHFSYEGVVQSAMARARGRLEDAANLSALAQQFGQTIGGSQQALRSAIDSDPAKPARYDPGLEEHELGSVLVSAVFDAFLTVYRRKIARYLRLATRGTGVLPPGDLPVELQQLLAEKASQLAAQFQSICIRAIDYCPPVDVEFGEFLRAVITADRDLVPDDKWAYREAWVDAFRGRAIYPREIDFLSEDALLWRSPRRTVKAIPELTFAALRFEGDPARPASAAELRRQAGALGQVVSRPEYVELFGLTLRGAPRLGRDSVDLPCVQSIRSSRRVGPDGQVIFDLIAEVTQTRHCDTFDFLGGSTIVIGPDGLVRYVISKSVLNESRLQRQREFLASDRGRALWVKDADGRRVPAPSAFRSLHAQTRFASSSAHRA
jgi:hypothetical protein